MNQLLVQYSYLQVLDLLTTIAFLLNGIQEANPVVRYAMRYSQSPFSALMAVKMAALALGFYCWRFGRERTLMRINIFFAVLVAWNLLALIAGSIKLA